MAKSVELTPRGTALFNQRMESISRQMAGDAKRFAAAQSVGSSARSTGQGMRSIAPFTSKKGNVVDRLGIRFKYYLIFVEHGVGRSRSVNDAPGKDPSRRSRPFLTKAVEKYYDDISRAVADLSANDMVHRNDQWLRNIARENSSITIKKI